MRYKSAIWRRLWAVLTADEYLHQYAERTAGIQLTPTARAKLPSAYGKDLEGERQRLLQYVESHMINISVRETVLSHGRSVAGLTGDYKANSI